MLTKARTCASIMNRKGQVTIPKSIRDRLGLKEGEKVLFVMQGEEVFLKIVKGTILDLRGSVQAFPTRKISQGFVSP